MKKNAKPARLSHPAGHPVPVTPGTPKSNPGTRLPQPGCLALFNRQRTRKIDLKRFQAIIASVLDDLAGAAPCEVGIHLVGAREMSRLNWEYLRHQGLTDVISFDYREYPFCEAPTAGRRPPALPCPLHGEIFICVDAAVEHAEIFHASWQEELIRYAIHGLLHIQGFDDRTVSERRRMRRAEEKFLKAAAKKRPLHQL